MAHFAAASVPLEIMVSILRQSALVQHQMAGADHCIKACGEAKLTQPPHQGRTRKKEKKKSNSHFAIEAQHSTMF